MTARSQRERGATLPIFALVLPVVILMTAFAVDLGRQRSSARDMQARADAVALDLVRLTGGTTTWPSIGTGATYTTALDDSAARNEVDPSKLTVVWGTWDEVNGFSACTIVTTCHATATIPTAVLVTAQEDTDYFFQPGTGHSKRTAVAATDAKAVAVLGTKLASISTDQSLLLDAIFGQVLHGTSLSGVGYGGLLGTNIQLGSLAAQLGFASPDDLANATVNARSFYLAAATVMQNQGNTAAATALNSIATQTNSNLGLQMNKVLAVEQGGTTGALAGGIDLYTLVNASVFAINGTNTISIPNAAVTIPNVTSTTISMSVTSRPVEIRGRVGATRTTDQVSITVTPTISSTISVLGLAGAGVSGTLPVTTTVAGGTGTITNIDCDATPSLSVGLAPQPISMATTSALTVSAKVLLATVPVATVDGPATTVTANGTSNGATFSYPTQFLPTKGTGTMVDAPSTSVGLAGSATVSSGNVTALGAIALPVPGLVTALNGVIAPVLSAIDTFVVNELNNLLGLNIGGADIGARDMSCDTVKLVG